MKNDKTRIAKRSLFSWILPGNINLQVLLVLIITVTIFARVFPLEMQKRIVNQAISLKKADLLFLYCSMFLGAVLLASGLKSLSTVLHTLISQRVLARMRKELYHHILTLPIPFFRKTGPGLVVSSLVNEIAPAGEFAGVAIATPLTSILTLLAFAVYLFKLNAWLAVLSLSIYPIVVFLVPMLQKRANMANKRRVDETRIISSKITESISGIHEIHGNGSYHIENERYDRMVDKLLRIRFVWSIYKQSIKLTNNFFNNFSPFLIFLVGGYLTIEGQLELGALVAFLSAQEKLYDPWRELIEFYELYQEATVGYKKTMDYFDIKPEHEIKPVDRQPYALEGSLEIRDLSFETEEKIRLLDEINLSLRSGEHLALVGFSGSGKSTLAQCIGQLYRYTEGQLLIGDKDVSELTKSDIAHNIGYIAQAPYIFDGTIEENILYSCASLVEENGTEKAITMPGRDDIIEILQRTGIFTDVLRFGLNAHLVYDRHLDLASRIIRVREEFQDHVDDAMSDYIEFFNTDKYLYYSSISKNLIFGHPNLESFNDTNLAYNPYFLKILDEAGLTEPLFALGDELAGRTVDILRDLPPDNLFFEQSPIRPEELEEYINLVKRKNERTFDQLSDRERLKFLELSLRFNPGRHKMIGLPPAMETKILEARTLFRERVSRDHPEAVTFFHISDFIYSQTLLNNILFGRINTEKTEAREEIYESIIQLLIEEELLETIVGLGLQFQVGTKGDRLSGGQRQKVAIVRAFLKRPKILIMDEATSGLDNKSQARIQRQLDTRWKGNTTVIAVVHRLDIVKNFDKVAVMREGKIVEMGSYHELIEKKGVLHELVTGQK